MEHGISTYERVERIKAVSRSGCKNLPTAKTIHEFILGLHAAAQAAGATVVKDGWFSHEFPVQGLTIVLVLAESAVTIHTYPECGRGVTINAAVCGTVDPADICRNMEAIFEPQKRVTETPTIELAL